MRIEIKATDRVHMLVWRAHPSADGDPGWRVACALNGTPIRFGSPFASWSDAFQAALVEAGVKP